MNKYVAILTKLPRSFSTAITKGRQPLLLWALLIAAIIGYILPWIVNPGTALTFNAYDLAEWASLTPAARISSPVLLASLLLRLPLVSVALLILTYTANRGWKNIFLALCFAGVLLPPFEFFTQATGDPNYRQQLVLAMITLLGGLVAWRRVPSRFERLLKLGLPVVSVVSGIWGLSQAYNLMRPFGLMVNIGTGSMVFIAAGLLLTILAFGSD